MAKNTNEPKYWIGQVVVYPKGKGLAQGRITLATKSNPTKGEWNYEIDDDASIPESSIVAAQ